MGTTTPTQPRPSLAAKNLMSECLTDCLKCASILECRWTADTLFCFVSSARLTVDLAWRDASVFVSEVFSYWKERREVDLADRVEF